MIPSKARLRSDRTLAKLSAEVNQTFGSPAAGLYLPREIGCQLLRVQTSTVKKSAA
jgi:hypothetical protein